MVNLRWYQSAAVQSVWDFLIGKPSRSPVVVLPTGAGKSLVIASVAEQAVKQWGGRVVILAHRKELLEQNAEKVCALIPDADVGIYSAGLNKRDTEHTILLAGIQSIYKRAHEIGARHLVIIDEAHLVPHEGEGMYRTFFDNLAKYNKFRTVGLTATPFRTDSGPLCHPEGLFNKICYSAPVKQLIEEGFLSPITNQATEVEADTSNLSVRMGEFVQHEAEALFGDEALIRAACAEIVRRTHGRKSILVFCQGVDHAERVAMELSRLTKDVCGLITGNTDPLLRASTLAEFKAGRMRICVNVNILTTGFDAPGIDAIAVLRATASPGLFAQIVGRGFRKADGKTDCVVLDFGQNFRRHGPMDDPNYGMNHKSGSTPGEAPVKKCPNCEEEIAAGANPCPFCGFEFKRELNHDATPDTGAEVFSEPQEWEVESVAMGRHIKKKEPDKPHTLRIDYSCRRGEGNLEMERISEWVCLNHEGFARKKAEAWWAEHTKSPLPDDDVDQIDAAIDLKQQGAFRFPIKITALKEGGFWRIVKREMPPYPELLGDAAESGAVFDEWAPTNQDDEVPF